MASRSLLGTSTIAAILTGFTACSLSTAGIGPEGGPTGSLAATSSGSGNGQGGSGGGGGDASTTSTSTSGSGGLPCESGTLCEDVPAGWTTVRVTKVGDASIPPGTCADMKTARKPYYTQPAGAPTCSACQCTPDAAAKCSAPQLECYFNNNNCSGGPDLSPQPDSSGCTDIPGVPGGANNMGSCKIGAAPKVLNSTCKTTGGTAPSTPLWGGAVFLCDSPSAPGDCAGGKLCVHQDGSSDGPVCIMKTGPDGCPPTWPSQTAAFEKGNDSRSCAACSCSIGCTGGGYVIHDLILCGDYNPSATINGACTVAANLLDNGVASYQATAATPMASCGGGQAMGQVDTTGPVQICCK